MKLGAVIQDRAKSRPIEAEIQALEDANARLSIAPLIRAGEFSTISENLTEADVAIREGRWADWLETATDRLPTGVGTVAKNLLITKDTALFQGLNRMVAIGDFVAKAVLYEHLTETRKVESQEALDTILEEFVQYNRLPGRTRDGLESLGLAWFWSYKLRIMKVAARTLRDRPLHALFMMGHVGPMSGVDSVWSGSLGGGVLEGSLGYSLGPEMGYNGLFLTPAGSDDRGLSWLQNLQGLFRGDQGSGDDFALKELDSGVELPRNAPPTRQIRHDR